MDFIVEKNRIFYPDENGQPSAYVTLEGDGDVWDLRSTFVPDEQRGKGLAGKLVEAAVAQARLQGKKIKPTCSYAVKAFEKNSEYADVLYEDGTAVKGLL